MASTIVTLGEKLDRIGKWLLPPGANTGSASALTEKLAAFLVPAWNLYWISYDKTTQQKALCCMPTDLQEHLSKALWKQPSTHYALTFGTMRDDTGFSFFKEELGITGCLDDHCILEYTCSSPFDYKNHTRLYISENTPLPDMNDPDYIPAISKQLQKMRQTGGEYRLLPTKHSKGRSITLAPFVVTILRQVKKQQSANRLRYGKGYEDSGFVFTDELGHHLSPQIVYRDFKK